MQDSVEEILSEVAEKLEIVDVVGVESQRLERVITLIEQRDVVEPPEAGPDPLVVCLKTLPVRAVGFG